MTINEAVKLRIEELLKEKQMTRYRLAMNSGIPHATLKNIMNNSITDNKVSTILLLCIGFDISISEFFDSKLFREENFNI